MFNSKNPLLLVATSLALPLCLVGDQMLPEEVDPVMEPILSPEAFLSESLLSESFSETIAVEPAPEAISAPAPESIQDSGQESVRTPVQEPMQELQSPATPQTPPTAMVHQKSCRQNWELGASFLYWRSFVPNLYYAINQSGPLSTQPTGQPFVQQNTTIWGPLKKVSYNWDPGFRISAAYLFGDRLCSGIHGAYTQFSNSGHGKIKGGSFLAPTFELQNLSTASGNTSNGLLQSASSSLKLHYNAADLLFDYFWLRHKPLSFDLFVGGRGVWIDQRWSSHYTNLVAETPFVLSGVAFASASGPLSNLFTVTNSWSFAGGGPRMGLRGGVRLFHWWKHHSFDFHARLAGSLLYGIHKIKMANRTSGGFVTGDASDGQHLWIPSYDLLLGLGTTHSYRCVTAKVHVDWEVTGFADLQQMMLYQLRQNTAYIFGSDQNGSVTLQGLTAGISVEF